MKTCLDCFNCKTKFLLDPPWPGLTTKDPSTLAALLLTTRIVFDGVHCAAGKWQVDSGEEFVYGDFNYAIKNPGSKRMRIAEECKEYCV